VSVLTQDISERDELESQYISISQHTGALLCARRQRHSPHRESKYDSVSQRSDQVCLITVQSPSIAICRGGSAPFPSANTTQQSKGIAAIVSVNKVGKPKGFDFAWLRHPVPVSRRERRYCIYKYVEYDELHRRTAGDDGSKK